MSFSPFMFLLISLFPFHLFINTCYSSSLSNSCALVFFIFCLIYVISFFCYLLQFFRFMFLFTFSNSINLLLRILYYNSLFLNHLFFLSLISYWFILLFLTVLLISIMCSYSLLFLICFLPLRFLALFIFYSLLPSASFVHPFASFVSDCSYSFHLSLFIVFNFLFFGYLYRHLYSYSYHVILSILDSFRLLFVMFL